MLPLVFIESGSKPQLYCKTGIIKYMEEHLMKAVILTGGEGTRLRPLTVNTLKCMVPVANRPFIEYQFDLLKKHDIKEAVLSICAMPEKIKRAIGDGSRYGMKVKYAVESEPLGTGGAIRNCLNYLDDTTLILNGDILTDINITDMVRLHRKKSAAVSIALSKVNDTASYGCVEHDRAGVISKFTEKPDKPQGSAWINAGIYIFSKSAVEFIETGRAASVEREVFPGLIASGERVQAYKSEYYWMDIGTIERYKQANFDAAAGVFKPLKKDIYPVMVKTNPSALGHPVVIAKGCEIEGGARVERSVIWGKTVIRAGARVFDSVVGEGCYIDEDSVVEGAVLGDGTRITKHSRLGK